MKQDRRSPIIGELRTTDETLARRPVPVLIELNLSYPGSVSAVTAAFFATWRTFRALPQDGAPRDGVDRDRPPDGLEYVTARIYQAVLSPAELEALVALDRGTQRHPDHERSFTIFKVWPDYELEAHIDRSATTVHADAARRTFSATGRGIVWAVVDSGIDAGHPHFGELGIADDARRAAGEAMPEESTSATFGLHRDFTHLVRVGADPDAVDAPADSPADGPAGSPAGSPAAPVESPLTDEDGHGTHVAGIIAGRCPKDRTPHVAAADEPTADEGFVSRTPSGSLSGMARECQLVSLKVLRRTAIGTLVTSSAAVLRALDYIRTEVNTDRGLLRIHGVNLSLGCEWDPRHYAAGRSPLCQAIDELVSSGVLVVVSAGNGGSMRAANPNDQVALMGSISEPAHADACIAVGSTHRDAPYAFGVTYTSAKGPTLDGRCKPDVVAPGEWITSAATGRLRQAAGLAGLADGTPDPTLTYAPDSGTSMAAPHVSGVLAAFLSVKTEFIGEPEKVKRILLDCATDLGRERYAQGHGLVDLLRMLSQT